MGERIYTPRRERELLEGLEAQNMGPLTEENLKEVFRTLIRVCRKSQG
jgi:chorismate mutase